MRRLVKSRRKKGNVRSEELKVGPCLKEHEVDWFKARVPNFLVDDDW